MKCVRCKSTMRRQKVRENVYQYVCPNCGLRIKARAEAENKKEEENQSASL